MIHFKRMNAHPNIVAYHCKLSFYYIYLFHLFTRDLDSFHLFDQTCWKTSREMKERWRERDRVKKMLKYCLNCTIQWIDNGHPKHWNIVNKFSNVRHLFFFLCIIFFKRILGSLNANKRVLITFLNYSDNNGKRVPMK